MSNPLPPRPRYMTTKKHRAGDNELKRLNRQSIKLLWGMTAAVVTMAAGFIVSGFFSAPDVSLGIQAASAAIGLGTFFYLGRKQEKIRQQQWKLILEPLETFVDREAYKCEIQERRAKLKASAAPEVC